MKKRLWLAVALILCVLFAGCGKGEQTTNVENENVQTETTELVTDAESVQETETMSEEQIWFK